MLRRLPLFSPVLVALVLSLASCAAPADEAHGTTASRLTEGDAVVNVDGLNLRSDATTSSEVLTVMPRGSRVHANGEERDGFSSVTFGAQQGWAWSAYLTPAAEAPPQVQVASLADAVASLAAEAPQRSPGTEVAIAVQNLSNGEYAGAADDVRHVSASSAKAIWVAAALHAGADLSDIARPIFRDSNNELSGVAIDRAGGPDAVNDFMWNTVGMERSLLATWFAGRKASNQGQMGGDNYFTAKDNVKFLSRLDRGELLDAAKTSTLETYMTWSPRSGYGGWLGTLLPAEVQNTMMHKSGWLPRSAYPTYATMNEIGIVQVPGGDRYAVSILARHGLDYDGAQRSFVERASCVIYRTIAKDGALGCRD